MFFRILIIAALLLSARQASAQAGLRPDGHLDTASLRDAYLQSDMPKVRTALEGFLKRHPKDVGKGEKVFTHLYLGAIYAGDPAQRSRAESHFRSLLKLEPGIDPGDMYFSPHIKDVYDEVKWSLVEEAARARDSALAAAVPPAASSPAVPPTATRTPAPAAPQPVYAPAASAPAAAAPPLRTASNTPVTQAPALADASGGKTWVWWTMGSAAAAVAAGVGVYALVQTTSDPEPRRLHVDATLR